MGGCLEVMLPFFVSSTWVLTVCVNQAQGA